jgi:hypothetical protein
MSSPNTDSIVEELAAISGVMRDDIHVSDDTVTTYIPTDQLEDAEARKISMSRSSKNTSTNT